MEEDRRPQVEAAIVRVLKARRLLDHNSIVAQARAMPDEPAEAVAYDLLQAPTAHTAVGEVQHLHAMLLEGTSVCCMRA